MTIKELIDKLQDRFDLDDEIVVAQELLDDHGRTIDTKYFEMEIAPWAGYDDESRSPVVIYPTELVSG